MCWQAWNHGSIPKAADTPGEFKCARIGCSYLRHSTHGHQFCCKCCAERKPHGEECERHKFQQESVRVQSSVDPRSAGLAKARESLQNLGVQPSLDYVDLSSPANLGSPGKPGAAKCARLSCPFLRHSSQPHGYCCRICCENAGHGPHCERRFVTSLGKEGPPSTSGSGEQPRKVATPMELSRALVGSTSEPVTAPAAQNKAASIRGTTKCIRFGCPYRRRLNPMLSFCCKACASGPYHDSECEREQWQTSPQGKATDPLRSKPAANQVMDGYSPVADLRDATPSTSSTSPAEKATAKEDGTSAKRLAAFWGIVDIKYDDRLPVGQRIHVLELGDGKSSKFSQHGRAVQEQYEKEYKPDPSQLRRALLVESKKRTHDCFVSSGYGNLRPRAVSYLRRYTSDLAKLICSDLDLVSDTEQVVLKLCNRSRGAGVVIAPVSTLDEVLSRLLHPPRDKLLTEWFNDYRNIAVGSTNRSLFQEACVHWWSNECPYFMAECCSHSRPVGLDAAPGEFDGTMRVGFVLRRKVLSEGRESSVSAQDTHANEKRDEEADTSYTDLSSLLEVEWLGGYWKLPKCAVDHKLQIRAASMEALLEETHSRIVSSFNSAEKRTASVAPGHLQEVYEALAPALVQVFGRNPGSPQQILEDYKQHEPLYSAYALARAGASLRNTRMKEAESLLEQAQKMVPNIYGGYNLPERSVLSYIGRNVAVCFSMQKMPKRALESVNEAINSLQTNATALYTKAIFRQGDGAFGEAAELLTRSLALDPDFKLPYVALASCRLQLGQSAEAQRAAMACISRHPDSSVAQFHIGQALYQSVFGMDGKLPASELAEKRQQGAQALAIAKDQLGEQWKPTHEDMLEYMVASTSSRKSFSRQEPSLFLLSGWRP